MKHEAVVPDGSIIYLNAPPHEHASENGYGVGVALCIGESRGIIEAFAMRRPMDVAGIRRPTSGRARSADPQRAERPSTRRQTA
jgi:hypothetical protein